MATKPITIGIVQPKITIGNKELNFNHSIEMMEQAIVDATDFQYDLFLLPETPYLGWIASNAKDLSEPAYGTDAKIVNTLRSFAKKHKVMVCSGFTELLNGKYYNSAVLIEQNGEILYVHRKNNEVGKGTEVYTNGSQMCVIPTSQGRIGVIICADNFVRWHHQILRKFRCELVLTPGAWVDSTGTDESTKANIDAWHTTLKRTSKGVNCPVIGANSIGTLEPGAFGAGRMWGNSIAYQDGNTLAAEGRLEIEEVVRCDIKITPKTESDVIEPYIFEGSVSVSDDGCSILTRPPPFYKEVMDLSFDDIGEQYEGKTIRMEIEIKKE